MEQHKIMISEESLRNDDFFINCILEELPNKKPSKDFTQNIMQKVAQQAPIKKESWYQSLGLWLILTGIGTLFAGFFGLLYYLCDKSIALMFHVILKFIERFEIVIPDFDLFLSGFNINTTLILVMTLVGIFVLIDLSLSASRKRKSEKLYSI